MTFCLLSFVRKELFTCLEVFRYCSTTNTTNNVYSVEVHLSSTRNRCDKGNEFGVYEVTVSETTLRLQSLSTSSRLEGWEPKVVEGEWHLGIPESSVRLKKSLVSCRFVLCVADDLPFVNVRSFRPFKGRSRVGRACPGRDGSVEDHVGRHRDWCEIYTWDPPPTRRLSHTQTRLRTPGDFFLVVLTHGRTRVQQGSSSFGHPPLVRG